MNALCLLLLALRANLTFTVSSRPSLDTQLLTHQPDKSAKACSTLPHYEI